MYLNTWEDFEKAAERLYISDPIKVSPRRRSTFIHISFYPMPVNSGFGCGSTLTDSTHVPNRVNSHLPISSIASSFNSPCKSF